MPRRKAAQKRKILADPLFRSEMLSKFINVLMRDGKKSIAERVVYKALDQVIVRMKKIQPKQSAKDDAQGGEGGEGAPKLNFSQITESVYEGAEARDAALMVFKQALENITPTVEVKSRRVGGSTYQVPIEVRAGRRRTLAMRWMVEYANNRNEKTMILRLANEIVDAYEGRGGAFKKREDVHRMAKANQAFSHLVRAYG